MRTCRVLRNVVQTAASRANSSSLTSTIQGRSTGLSANSVAHEPERVAILLRKTASLLPRTLSTADGAFGPESSLFWSNILERSIAELCSGSDQVPLKATIAVCGFDKWAGSHDLVTALLEDPFSSDPTYSDILRNRWKNAPSYITIEYGKPTAYAGELSSPSDWLQRFPHPVQLIELPGHSSLSGISGEADNLLLSSDVLLLLSDPVVTPFSDLAIRARHLLNKPNTILVLTSGTVSDHHHQSVSRTLSHLGCQPGQILFVNPRQALDAVTALQTSPALPSAIDRYQRDAIGSRISTVTTAINDILSQESSRGSLMDVRQKTALWQVQGSLSAGFRSVEVAKKDVERVAGKIDDLSLKVQKIRDNARRDIVGEQGENDQIEKALSLSAKEMDTLLRSLTFWKMIWRVDEIGALVSTAVQTRWCKGLENQLILHTGYLESGKRQLSASVFGLVSASLPDALRSPILENQLQQLNRLPNHVLMPNSLTQPIHDRRCQLIRYTTTKLHREAQSAVVGAFGSVLSGACLGWWLAFGEHILSLGAGAEMGTAIGSGALLAVSGMRWAVGKWERAKWRWAQDSERIGEGLRRDLHSTIQRTVDDNVTIVASTACKGMQDLIDRRRGDICQLHKELSDADAELGACVPFSATWTGHRTTLAKEVDIE